jgi:adenosine kinase
MKVLLSLVLLVVTIKCDDYSIIGFGSPILDSIVNMEDAPELGEQIKLRLSYHMDKDFPVEFYQSVINSEYSESFLGGSAMNTIRLVNFLIKSTDKVCFFGSIGNDKFGENITESLELEGIVFNKQVIENERTSTCIVLVEQHERMFFSDLAVSNKISLTHFENMKESIIHSKIFYADAYLLGSRFDIFKYVFEEYYNEDVILSLNAASHNIIRDYFMNFVSLFPYIDLIFLNEEELNELKIGFNLDMDNIEFMLYLQHYEHKSNKKQRIIVNTNGSKDTIIANNEGVFIIPVYKVRPEDIIDTNGAGDSFSGGFLAGMLMGYNIEESAKLGNYIASKVIMLKGFQIPTNVDIGHIKLLRLTNDWNIYS